MAFGWVTAIALAIASTALGIYGLHGSKALPPSARLGEMAGLDRNGDGRISAAEWNAAGRTPSAMAKLDTDRSGYLEPAETRRRRAAAGGGE